MSSALRPTDFEVTALNGAVTNRVMPLVGRVTW
jgi:hypothetical protein